MDNLREDSREISRNPAAGFDPYGSPATPRRAHGEKVLATGEEKGRDMDVIFLPTAIRRKCLEN